MHPIGEHGPEIVWVNRGDYVPAASETLATMMQTAFDRGCISIQLRQPGARDDDDGSAGVFAKV